MRKTTLALLAIAGAGHGMATPAAAQFATENLSIHGYMTQAYARADSLINGIPSDGTADLRTAAIQLRYAITPQDNFVVQARHRRLGETFLTNAEDDVQLQWAFYQRRMGGFSFRAGKVPLPMGLYSEIRNVGTILPFFQAPATVYPLGVETFDGVNVNYDLALGAWGVEAGANFGSFVIDLEGENGTVQRPRSDIKYAGMLTVNTPLPGLRVRGTINTFEGPSRTNPSVEERTTVKVGSVDGTFTRFNVRGEWARVDAGATTKVDLAYAQAGVKVHPRVTLNTQYELSKVDMSLDIPGMGPFKFEQTSLKDYAIGANYSLSPNVVFKLEGHHADRPIGFGDDRRTDNYLVSSVSVSF